MTYNIAKLADFKPALATELKTQCYAIVGLCQQVQFLRDISWKADKTQTLC